MTEAEWLASSDPEILLRCLPQDASARKLRLFACGCCRRIWDALPDVRSRKAVEVAERFADEQATVEELAIAWQSAREAAFSCAQVAAWAAADTALEGSGWSAVHASRRARIQVAATSYRWWAPWFSRRAEAREKKAQADLLRELFGTAFGSSTVALPWLTWGAGTIPAIAHRIYEERRFADLPILADALEEAGCTDESILDHCRKPAEHVPGCWVLDLLLDKQ